MEYYEYDIEFDIHMYIYGIMTYDCGSNLTYES
jgi:hypothetical protein